ncbi:integration host factor subunit alpha [Novimethylophilus kurashikiensis]|uniref:Integration host factor subunit alpha n=1 Tax=Novimethylophilus kurashikiensis TaxID=1825523 RepID=A0A2R5FDB7_9PROT|nr:HU family DNA-binding protein [Novimethylophilus kurashikiensis]GBG14873.1 integration host factor subunit alpha [Novimethylophilus kurashikiensis]
MADTFNMKDLSNAVAAEFGLTRQDGANLTRFIFDKVTAELAQGKQVRLHKFGTLEARNRAAGVARNPITNERIVVPARRVLKLTVSPAVKAML